MCRGTCGTRPPINTPPKSAASASTPLPATSGIMIGIKAKLVPCTIGRRAPTGPETDGLEQRRDTCKQHRHLDQVGHVRETLRARVRAEAETCRPRDDDRRCDVGYEHRQHVLDAQRNGPMQRGCIVRIAELFRRPDCMCQPLFCPSLWTYLRQSYRRQLSLSPLRS